MHTKDTIAVLADIHGNSLALEAVLAHARAHDATRFYNLGDTFYGPLDPAGTWAILRDTPMDTILGNQDRVLLEGGPEWEAIPAFTRTLDAITPDGIAWLGTLDATLRPEPDVLLCHGTPKDDMTYLLEDVTTGLPALRSDTALNDALMPEAKGCTLVLAGHSHHAGLCICNDITALNPGSVGLPAYDDDAPPHIMASGSPHARYALISRTQTGWDTEFMTVEYDWAAAAAMARANGREDWAEWILTGMA